MPLDTQKALLFGAAAALRLLLFTFLPALPALLAGRVEVSTPVTSFKRCTALAAPQLYLYLCMPANPIASARGPVPLHPQCLALRRRPLPPGAPPSAAVLPPAEPILLPNRHEHCFHSGGSSERICIGPGCAEWSCFCLQAVLIFEEGSQMEQHSHCSRVWHILRLERPRTNI